MGFMMEEKEMVVLSRAGEELVGFRMALGFCGT